MRAGTIQQETVVVSVVLAALVAIGAGLVGHIVLGAGLGAGLVLGSFNGFIIQSMLDRGAPMLAAGLLRLAGFTILALIIARLLGGSIWPVVIGIGAAQLVMVSIGVRQGRRA